MNLPRRRKNCDAYIKNRLEELPKVGKGNGLKMNVRRCYFLRKRVGRKEEKIDGGW